MIRSQKSDLVCSHCDAPVREEDAYCPNCGALFTDDAYCLNHALVRADGVCVLCTQSFCSKCGKESNGVFLCDTHWRYEITEGMVRVFGCTDNVHAQYVTTTLAQAGYHPFLYSRKFNPGADLVSVAGYVRNFGNHPIIELKVLVPFSELLEAEETLRKLGLFAENGTDAECES